MSLTIKSLDDGPYAATIHSVGLGDHRHGLRPAVRGLLACPLDSARSEALDARDQPRALWRAGRGRQQRVDRRRATPQTFWAPAR